MFTWGAPDMQTVETWGPSACLTRVLSVFALVNHSVQESKLVCACCSRICVGGSSTRASTQQHLSVPEMNTDLGEYLLIDSKLARIGLTDEPEVAINSLLATRGSEDQRYVQCESGN
jgi:hypothetical protein